MNSTMEKKKDLKKQQPMHQKVEIDLKHLEEKIRKDVIDKLGKPDGLSEIKIFNVYGDSWRVNIYTQKPRKDSPVKDTVISHSFFCRIRKDGRLIYNPKIEKKY